VTTDLVASTTRYYETAGTSILTSSRVTTPSDGMAMVTIRDDPLRKTSTYGPPRATVAAGDLALSGTSCRLTQQPRHQGLAAPTEQAVLREGAPSQRYDNYDN
jgi:hypothetical protein